MFTGIVQELGVVTSASLGKLVIAAAGVLQDMEPGDSIAVNGACLTITSLDPASVSVDVVPETLRRTNLGLLKAGDKVNLEADMIGKYIEKFLSNRGLGGEEGKGLSRQFLAKHGF